MNIFRLVGDISHLLAIIILLRKIWTSRSCAGESRLLILLNLLYLYIFLWEYSFLSIGVSLKSQILFLLVFTTRYLDLVTSFVSVYNSSMKVIYLLASGATCFLIYFKFRATYDRNHDSFRFEFLIIPCVLMALVINHEFSIFEVMPAYFLFSAMTLTRCFHSLIALGSLDVLDLSGVSSYIAAAVPDQQDRRS